MYLLRQRGASFSVATASRPPCCSAFARRRSTMSLGLPMRRQLRHVVRSLQEEGRRSCVGSCIGLRRCCAASMRPQTSVPAAALPRCRQLLSRGGRSPSRSAAVSATCGPDHLWAVTFSTRLLWEKHEDIWRRHASSSDLRRATGSRLAATNRHENCRRRRRNDKSPGDAA